MTEKLDAIKGQALEVLLLGGQIVMFKTHPKAKYRYLLIKYPSVFKTAIKKPNFVDAEKDFGLFADENRDNSFSFMSEYSGLLNVVSKRVYSEFIELNRPYMTKL